MPKLNDAVGADMSVKLAAAPAVAKPLALIVILVNAPTLLLTVAKVPVPVTFPVPSKAADV